MATNDTVRTAALFDLDGVIVDTEGRYTDFWRKIGAETLGIPGFGDAIKGRTLEAIFDTYYKGKPELQAMITEELDRFEREMPYDFIPGAMHFIRTLRERNVPVAVVTSSNRKKMENVYARHPGFKETFDRIFTGEDFPRSKPAPDCYLLGMKTFGATAASTVIFEDSYTGLKAARDSGGFVVGLATTNTREDIAPLADKVIDNFTQISADDLSYMLRSRL